MVSTRTRGVGGVNTSLRLGCVIKGIWQNLSKQGMGPPSPANENVEYTS